MNISLNNLFLIISVAELANGAAKKVKEGWCIWNKIPDRNKADELADRDAPLLIREKRLSWAIKEKESSPKTTDIELTLSAIEDKRPSLESSDSKPTLLVIETKNHHQK